MYLNFLMYMAKPQLFRVTLFAVFVFCIVYIYDFLIILLSFGIVVLLPNNSFKHHHQHSIKGEKH